MPFLHPLKERELIERWKKQAGNKNDLMADLVHKKTFTGEEARIVLTRRKSIDEMIKKAALARTFVSDGEFHTAMVVYTHAAGNAMRAGLTSHAREYLEEAIKCGKSSNADAHEIITLEETLKHLS